MLNCVGILLGGGIGAVLRFLITRFFAKITPKNKHIGTLLVNILGSFALGYLYVALEGHTSILYKTVVVGLIASFTTFSSYEFDNLTLIAGKRYREAFNYAFGSCVVCLMSLCMGMIVAKF